MNTLKIAYFIGSLNRGGAESLILDICRQSKYVPYDFICVYRKEGNMSDAFHQTNTSMIHVPRRFGFLRYLVSLRKILLQERISIVHSQTTYNTLLLAVALLGTSIKIITTFHGYNFSKAPLWQRKVVYTVSKKILCVSDHQKQWYEKKWNLSEENKLQVVYNGIDFSKLESEKLIMERGKWKVKSGRLRLCMVGNFVDVRSQIILVKSINHLKERGITNFDFYFVGKRVEQEKELYDECVNYSKEHHLDNVHFLGSRGDVPALLKSMDGFVYSSARDTFGIAVLEAILSGLPIVVNDWPVMIEVCEIGLTESNKSIRFFRTESVEDCAEQIEKLINDLQNHRDLLKKDCQKAAEAAKQKYSIQNHIGNLSKIYSNL